MSREARTWGPFNGRQLTTIVCVLAVTVLFPFGAWAAVSFTNVAITDPGGVNQAKVDANGRLSVGDGKGALTVDGSVSPALPSKPITIPVTGLSGPGTQVFYGPQSKPFGISSITLGNSCNIAVSFYLYASQSTGGLFNIEYANVGPGETTHLVYPSPLVSSPPPGGTVTLEASPSEYGCISMTAVGVQS
jgi:hypothetical protein